MYLGRLYSPYMGSRIMAKLLDKKVGGRYPHSYVPSASTDVAATFRRIRKQMAERDQRPTAAIPIARARKDGAK